MTSVATTIARFCRLGNKITFSTEKIDIADLERKDGLAAIDIDRGPIARKGPLSTPRYRSHLVGRYGRRNVKRPAFAST